MIRGSEILAAMKEQLNIVEINKDLPNEVSRVYNEKAWIKDTCLESNEAPDFQVEVRAVVEKPLSNHQMYFQN